MMKVRLPMPRRRRPKSLLSVVEEAVRLGRVILAFLPFVSNQTPRKIVTYEGLTRIIDNTERIIPASQFINKEEDSETGRLIAY